MFFLRNKNTVLRKFLCVYNHENLQLNNLWHTTVDYVETNIIFCVTVFVFVSNISNVFLFHERIFYIQNYLSIVLHFCYNTLYHKFITPISTCDECSNKLYLKTCNLKALKQFLELIITISNFPFVQYSSYNNPTTLLETQIKTFRITRNTQHF